MLVGIVTDNLYRVLVCTDCAIGTQAIVFGFELAFASHSDFFFLGQGSERYVVYYTDSKVVFGNVQLQIVVHGQDLCRCSIF